MNVHSDRYDFAVVDESGVDEHRILRENPCSNVLFWTVSNDFAMFYIKESTTKMILDALDKTERSSESTSYTAQTSIMWNGEKAYVFRVERKNINGFLTGIINTLKNTPAQERKVDKRPKPVTCRVVSFDVT